MERELADRLIRETLHLPNSATPQQVAEKCEEMCKVVFSGVQPLLDGVHVLKNMPSDQKHKFHELGLAAISRNEVGVIIMAGGLGTRLGSDKIKGAFDIGLPSHKSLFCILCERILSLQRRVGRGIIPLYVMTCDINEEETRDFFRDHNYFGLSPENVRFFSQGVLPCIAFNGDFLLDESGKISSSPNGNGGLYQALAVTGMLDDMTRRGVRFLHCFSVDNILCKVADPIFVGLCVENNIDCAAKVVTKHNPKERVGVLCRDSKGRPGVVEYSEMTEEQACMRILPEIHAPAPIDSSVPSAPAPLAFRGGCICNHMYSLEFLKKCVGYARQMKLHIAKKQVPYLEEGRMVQPPANNAYKIELFFFDVFEFTRRFLAYEVDRESEFSPVKNATGADSPQTARDALFALHRKWIEVAGGIIPDRTVPCEISPLTSYEGEGLEQVRGQQLVGSIEF